MLLCVDRLVLKRDLEVQKDLDIPDIITDHIRYFEDEETAANNNYEPLTVSLIVRSAYTNKVLRTKSGKLYLNFNDIPSLPHRGVDLIMYCCAALITHIVKGGMSANLSNIMMQSQITSVGVYYDFITHPMLVMQCVLSDNMVEEFSTHLIEEYDMVDILSTDNYSVSWDCERAIRKTIIEVKPEVKEDE